MRERVDAKDPDTDVSPTPPTHTHTRAYSAPGLCGDERLPRYHLNLSSRRDGGRERVRERARQTERREREAACVLSPTILLSPVGDPQQPIAPLSSGPGCISTSLPLSRFTGEPGESPAVIYFYYFFFNFLRKYAFIFKHILFFSFFLPLLSAGCWLARIRCALLQIPVNGGFGKYGDRGEGMRGPRGSVPGDCQRHEGK